LKSGLFFFNLLGIVIVVIIHADIPRNHLNLSQSQSFASEAAGQHAQALRDYSALIDVQPYNAIALVQKGAFPDTTTPTSHIPWTLMI
jgi:hypothetical protein